jgi:hypothetical protein
MIREIKMALGGAALLVTIIFAGQRFAATHGADRENLKQAIQQTRQGEKTLERVDTVYVRDTIRLSRAVTRLQRMRDTLRITDTVQVKEFIAQTDATMSACFSVVRTCEQKDSTHRVIEAGLRRQNEALKALIPSRTERFIAATKWAAIGAVLGAALIHR